MQRILGELLDLLVPRACAACGAETVTLCGRCLGELAVPVRSTVPRYGTREVHGAGEYTGVLRDCLLAYKERDRRDLTALLGLLLARAVLAVLEHSPGTSPPPASLSAALPAAPSPPAALLVPVPATAAAVRRRGADHVAALGARAAAVLRAEGLDVRCAPLLEVRAHRDQVGFGSTARRRNVRGTHRTSAGAGALLAGTRTAAAAGARIVVLDDICTTGATVAESTRALAAARIPVTGVAVVGIAPGGSRTTPGDGI